MGLELGWYESTGFRGITVGFVSLHYGNPAVGGFRVTVILRKFDRLHARVLRS